MKTIKSNSQLILLTVLIFTNLFSTSVIAQINDGLRIDTVNWELNVVQSFNSENGLEAEHINDFAFDENGMTWISTNAGIWLSDGYTIFPFENDVVKKTEDYSKLTMLKDTLWLADKDALYSINIFTHESEKYQLPEYVFKVRPQSITTLSEHLVIHTNNGPLIFSLNTLSFFKLLDVPEFSEKLSSTIAFDSVVIGENLYVGYGSYIEEKKSVQGGIAVYDSEFELVQFERVVSLFSPWTIEYIDGLIFAPTSNRGLLTIDPRDLAVVSELKPPLMPVRAILSANKNENDLWLSLLQGGLLREKDNQLIQFTDKNSQISSNMTSVAKVDAHGHLWVGYFNKRIDVINTNNLENISFQKYEINEFDISVSHVSDSARIIGTLGNGLLHNDQYFTFSKIDDYEMNDLISAVDSFKSHTIIGTKGGGIWRRNNNNEYEKLIDKKPFNRLVVDDLLALDSKILAATGFGFYLFDYEGNLVEHSKTEYRNNDQRLTHFERNSTFLYDGFRIGRLENSLQNIDWHELPQIEEFGVIDLSAKSKSEVYFISDNKLFLYNFETQELQEVFKTYSNLTNVLFANGYLFLTDRENLFISNGQEFLTYSSIDGFRGTDIDHKALQAYGDTLLVASKQGIQEIKYKKLIDVNEPNKAAISSIILDGNAEKTGLLRSVSLNIKPDVSFANLEIVVPANYTDQASLSYTIPKFLDVWLPIDDSMVLQLPLNQYGQFRVLLRDNRTLEPINLDIQYEIEKPWWLKTTSILFFLLIGILLITLFFVRRERANKRQTTLLEEKVRHRTYELNSVLEQKNTLFENISHEFRTPLTIILSNIKSSSTEPKIIENQCERLLTLVNNLLALAEARSPNPKFSLINLESKANLLVNGLDSLAADRGLKIENNIVLTKKYAEVYEGLLDLLINNILGNAVKYASKASVITFSLRGKADTLELEVENTTDSVMNDSILERYTTSHREQQNTGLGLDIVRELVNRLNGKLQTSYLDGKFAVCIRIPVSFVDEDSEKTNKPEPLNPKAGIPSFASKPLVMIVEDNSELRGYLNNTFETSFEIVQAKDGQEALDWLRDSTTIPELIISDVVMPKMGGFELCENVKKDPELNSTPFILLTAKTDLASQAKGYELQADDYIGKPFNSDILMSKSSNLIRTLQRAKASAEKALLGIPKSIEDEFVSKLRAFLDVNYFNSELSASSLANHLNISERTLERRLSAKLGTTFSSILRKFRIERACEMLLNGKPIKETAYDCGFSSHSYFGQCFKQERGMTPSDFVKSNNK